MAKIIEEKAKKTAKRKTSLTFFKILLLIVILFLTNVYIIFGIKYKGENFTVSLDNEKGRANGLVVFDNNTERNPRTFLKSDDISGFSDISINWLPKDIDNEGDGSHNGSNYIAYTFYVQNQTNDTLKYWTVIEIDDVIKNVDDAIRVMVIKNGEKTVYAKSATSGEPEKNTVPFYEEKVVMSQANSIIESDAVDKFTVVIWVEGDDPECLNNLIGGEIQMHMTIREEHVNE